MDNFCAARARRGTLAGMSYSDLPRDWPELSLADPALAADVLDLCVSDADRRAGALAVLLCRPGGALSQPLLVEQVPAGRALREAVSAVVIGALPLPGVDGVVVGLVRPRGPVTDADRAVHQHTLEVCRRAGLLLHGTFLVTLAGVEQLPVGPTAPSVAGRDVA